jgi:hypothetical protein
VEEFERRVRGTAYVGDLPARLCKTCGKLHVDPAVVRELEDAVEHVARGGDPSMFAAFDIRRVSTWLTA